MFSFALILKSSNKEEEKKILLVETEILSLTLLCKRLNDERLTEHQDYHGNTEGYLRNKTLFDVG